jgi:hypothetical protein
MRVVANVWDQVQLRPWHDGRSLYPRRKSRAVMFDADHERLHLDEGPVVDTLPLMFFRFVKYGLSTASRSCRIQRAAGPSS